MAHRDEANTSLISDCSTENEGDEKPVLTTEKPSGLTTVTVCFDDVRHIHAVDEFGRQVLGRINDQDVDAFRISKYMVQDAKEKLEVDKELADAIGQITGIPGHISWDTEKKPKKEQKTGKQNDGPFSFECDLYLHLSTMNGKDMIAQTPNSLRNKLEQLERAFRYYEKNKAGEEGKKLGPPSAAVICLNGERADYKRVVQHIQELFCENKLQKWDILKSNVPVFVTFTPYRNIYGSLKTINTELKTIKALLAAIAISLAIAGLLAGLGMLQMLAAITALGMNNRQ
eukprot:scaffold180528_cov53-Attheya_sp.AAC.2